MTTHADARADDGFGLVEILISMFLLALLSIAFLPLLVESLRVTVTNSQIATANQILSEQLDQVTLVDRSCAAFDAFETSAIPTVTDERGTVYQATRAVSGCPAASYPAAVQITLTVTVVGSPEIESRAVTSGIVESAN